MCVCVCVCFEQSHLDDQNIILQYHLAVTQHQKEASKILKI